MISRLLSYVITVAMTMTVLCVSTTVLAGNAADAMNKLKEQAAIKAESSTTKVSASSTEAEAAAAKAKAKKAVKELLKKKKLGD